MVASARRMLPSALTARHPDWDEVRVEDEVARRIARGGWCAPWTPGRALYELGAGLL